MSEKKGSRLLTRQSHASGNTNGTDNNTFDGNTSLPDKNETVKLFSAVEVIGGLLHYGQEQAVHVAELVQLTGYSDRLIRAAVDEIRARRKKDGVVVCGDECGLYYALTREEAERWRKKRLAAARSIERSTGGVKYFLRKIGGEDPEQLSLFDGGGDDE